MEADVVHRLDHLGGDRLGQDVDRAAALAAQLRAVDARRDELERGEQPVRIGDAPAGEDRCRAAEAAHHAVQQLDEPRGTVTASGVGATPSSVPSMSTNRAHRSGSANTAPALPNALTSIPCIATALVVRGIGNFLGSSC